MNTFKDGDKVYCPMFSTKVLTIQNYNSHYYSLAICEKGVSELFTQQGFLNRNIHIKGIIHATQQNKDLLEKLYGVEFEAVPPTTITVTFELPETFAPEIGEGYFFINSGVSCGVGNGTNYGHVIDKFRIGNGVWRTEEEALQVANAIFKLNKD